MTLPTVTGWMIVAFLGLSELILIALFAIGIIVIPLPGRLFGRGRTGGHSIAGGKPVQWSGKFRTGRIETIHTAAEAFFCSYPGGEYTLGDRERFRLTFHRGPWHDQGGGQLVPVAYAGARPDELPLILRVVMQPRKDGLLITVRHEVIPPAALSRADRKALTRRFKREVAAFRSYLADNFAPPADQKPDARRPRKRISVIQKNG